MTTKSFCGFSLVELMVAVLISSILLGGVITMLSISKRTYNLQDELSVLQDNARFVIDELTRQIRLAGYKGCKDNKPVNIAQVEDSPSIPENPFFDGSKNDIQAPDKFPSSDRLVITGFGEELLQFLPNTPLSTTIELNEQVVLPPIASNVIVSDCKSSFFFKAQVKDNALKLETIGQSREITDFRVGYPEIFNGVQETIYEVRYQPILGLYRCQDDKLNGQCDKQEQLTLPFADGVQSMQVRYGVLNSNQIHFKTDTQKSDNVVAVRITLLMRTPHKKGIPKTTEKIFYLDPNEDYNPSDNLDNETGFRHRLFSTTIAVRNKAKND